MQPYRIINGDCYYALRAMPNNFVDAIVTDPPYFKVKDDAWDRQWGNDSVFLGWLGAVFEEFKRLLKPNGSLLVFASPQMAARVEVEMRKKFDVLNHLVWAKPRGRHNQICKETLRGFFPASERIIFAEHYGADNRAKRETGYGAACDELRGFVFEPLRAYLAGEWERAGLTTRDANIATNSQMSGHWLSRSQWELPTRERYEQLRAYANRSGGDYFRREYEDLRREYEDLRREYEDLRREYEDLRREYEDLRRPFSVTADVPYTDVWTFETVSHYPGKHPCEKPLDLMEHIVRSCTRPGALILDPFTGSGSTGVAAVRLGRRFVGCELDPKYVKQATARIEEERRQHP